MVILYMKNTYTSEVILWLLKNQLCQKLFLWKKRIGGKCNFSYAGGCMELEKKAMRLTYFTFWKSNLSYALIQFWGHIYFTHSKEMRPRKEGGQIYERSWYLKQSINVYWLNWCLICTTQLTHVDISFVMMISIT